MCALPVIVWSEINRAKPISRPPRKPVKVQLVAAVAPVGEAVAIGAVGIAAGGGVAAMPRFVWPLEPQPGSNAKTKSATRQFMRPVSKVHERERECCIGVPSSEDGFASVGLGGSLTCAQPPHTHNGWNLLF